MSELERLKHELKITKIALNANREELQSLIEESSAVKMDFQARLASLHHAYDDLRNFWDNAPIAMLFLNRDMSVIRFTPSIVNIYPLQASDIGRQIKDLVSTFTDYDVVSLAQKVIADGTISDTEEKNKHDEWYRVRISPYLATSDVIDGVVITFENISDIKAIQTSLVAKTETLHESEERFRLILEKGEDVFTIIDLTGNYLAYRGPSRFGLKEETTVGKNVRDFFDPEVVEIIMSRIRQVIESGESSVFESEICWEGENLNFIDHLYPLHDSNGNAFAVGTLGKNVTKERATIENLKAQINRLKNGVHVSY